MKSFAKFIEFPSKFRCFSLWVCFKNDSSVLSSFLLGGRGVEPPTKFSKRAAAGGLTGSQLLEGGCWEGGGDFIQGVAIFTQKYILKSEIINDKKCL